MTDRELLELAAKAAEINYPWHEGEFGGGLRIELGGGFARFWNPLSDDGDAFRLAVKLGLYLDTASDGETDVLILDNDGGEVARIIEKHINDPYAATRKCIVRAAAEIGKQLQS